MLHLQTQSVAMEPRASDSEMTWGTQQSIQRLTVDVGSCIKQEVAEDQCIQTADCFSETTEANFDVSIAKVEHTDSQGCSAGLNNGLHLTINEDKERASAKLLTSAITEMKQEAECKVEVEDHALYNFDSSETFVESCTGYDADLVRHDCNERGSQADVFVCYNNCSATGKDCLTKHMKRHRNGTVQKRRKNKRKGNLPVPVYRCAECNHTTNSKGNLSKHFNALHNRHAEVYKCPYCAYGSKYKTNINKHVKLQHNPDAKLYRCTVCEFATKHAFSLTKHVNTQHDFEAPLYRCTQCDYTAKLKTHLTRHATLKHGLDPPVHQCAQCGFATKFKFRLTEHVTRKHSLVAPVYRCANCSYTNELKRNLLTHIKVHHNRHAEVYQCAHCDYETKYKSQLTRHVKFEHDTSVYRCRRCDFTTKRRICLNAHVAAKHGLYVPVYQSTQCEFATKSYGHVTGRRGSGTRVRQGTQRDPAAKLKYNLTRNRSSSGAPAYRCTQCDFATKLKSCLTRHVTGTHSPDAQFNGQVDWFKCKRCDFGSEFKRELIKHWKDRHKRHDQLSVCTDGKNVSVRMCTSVVENKETNDAGIRRIAEEHNYVKKHIQRLHKDVI